MPAPKSRQGGPGSAGASLKHLNPTVAERKVKFEVSVARHALLAAFAHELGHVRRFNADRIVGSITLLGNIRNSPATCCFAFQP